MANPAPDAGGMGPEAATRLRILLARPRGFCAGVERAIAIVERAIDKFGPPVYVRHEIVHNRQVVRRLAARGAVFVDEIEDAPPERPIIFSAHGVPRSVPLEARARGMFYLDATCPLVSKVHSEVTRHHAAGREVLLIGHAGHPEVLGTMGQTPPGSVRLIETLDDARAYLPGDPTRLAFVTQTTLSVDDTAEIVACLRERFPTIVAPRRDDICYATANRQAALSALAAADVLLVVGSANSSNARRLAELGRRLGPATYLIEDADALEMSWLDRAAVVGVTAAASTPEDAVQALLTRLRDACDVTIEEVDADHEDVSFNLPRVLA